MDGLRLLQSAREAGLQVWLEDGNLKIKGPKRLAALALEVIENKVFILPLLSGLRSPAPREVDNSLSADADTRPVIAGKNRASVNQGGAKTAARCGSLHLQPREWNTRDDRATCPSCGKFMGYLRKNGNPI
jgi:hypothetical protein